MPRRGKERAEVLITADSKALGPELRRSRRKFETWSKKTTRTVGRTFRGLGRNLSTVIGFGAAAAFAGVGKKVIELDKRVARFALNSRTEGQTIRQAMAGVGDELERVSNLTGLSQEKVFEGVTAFLSATGNRGAALANAELFAKLSQVTGADMESLAKAAAAMEKTLGVGPENMERAFDALLVGGRKGSIEIQNIAPELGKLSAAFKAFGNEGVAGVAELTAALQVIGPAAGFSGAEASTAFIQFLSKVQSLAPKIKKELGIDLVDPITGAKLGVTEFAEELKKTGVLANRAKFTEIFGRSTELFKAADALANNTAEIREITAAALKGGKVQKDFIDLGVVGGLKLEKAWQKFQNKLRSALTEGDRMDKLVRAAEALADALIFAVDHLGEIAVILIGAKLGSGFIELASMLGTLSAGNPAGKVAKLGKVFGGAAGVLIAGTVGLAIGKILDDTFGISDKVSDALVGEGPTGGVFQTTSSKIQQSLEGTGFIRDRAKELTGPRAAAASAGFAATGQFSQAAQRSSRTLLSQAETQGISTQNTSGQIKEALEFATKIRSASREQQQRQRVEIAVTVNQNGLLQARLKEQREARRKLFDVR